MTFFNPSVVSLFICFTFAYSEIRAEEVIWPEPDFPPFTFMNDSDALKDKGIHQLGIHYLVSRLPSDWVHKFELANYKRMVADISAGQPKIIAGLFKTPKRIESGVRYTQAPMHLILTNQLVILKSSYPKFAKFITGGKINLEKIVVSKTVNIAVSHGRSYSGVIDTILNRHRDKVFTRATTDEKGLFSMLEHKRVDAIFEFPTPARFTAQNMKIKDKIMLIPILGMAEYTEAFIAGPSGEWGKKVIGAIDDIMKSPGTIKAFTQHYSDWLPNEESARSYHKIVQKYYQDHYGMSLQF